MIGADIRRGEWGSKFPTDLVRDFIRSSLRHSAAADMVSEYVFDIATSGEAPPADIGEALRVAIGEVLSAATSEDWEQVGRDLLADAHDCLGEARRRERRPRSRSRRHGGPYPQAARGARRRSSSGRKRSSTG